MSDELPDTPVPAPPEAPQPPEPASVTPVPPEHHVILREHEAPMHFLPVVLFIIVLLVICGSAYGVYDWQHGKVTNLNTQLTSSQKQVDSLQGQVHNYQKELATMQIAPSTSQASTSTSVVKIASLGVEITVPSSIKDVAYKANPDSKLPSGQQTESVTLSTQTLTDLSEACSVNGDAPALGILSKTSGQYPKDADVDNTSGTLVKQYVTYYIGYTSPQAICSTDTTTEKAAGTDLSTFIKALNNSIKPIS